jgi:hypothetical protein
MEMVKAMEERAAADRAELDARLAAASVSQREGATQWGGRATRINSDGFDERDMFETDRRSIEALLRYLEPFKGKGYIWECCHGYGAITQVLREHGFQVIATDLFTIPGQHVDFLNVSCLILSIFKLSTNHRYT